MPWYRLKLRRFLRNQKVKRKRTPQEVQVTPLTQTVAVEKNDLN